MKLITGLTSKAYLAEYLMNSHVRYIKVVDGPLRDFDQQKIGQLVTVIDDIKAMANEIQDGFLSGKFKEAPHETD